MKIRAGNNFSGSFSEERAERDNYTAFFRKYYPSLVFYATRFLEQEQAEDVVQDAFLDLWQRRDRIDKGDNLRAFMYRSVYTRVLNKLKHAAVTNNYQALTRDVMLKKAKYLTPDNNDVLRKIESEELGAVIDTVIESLPEKCRQVFKLSYLHGLKNREIADSLGISLKTAEAHMYKALKILRERLGYLN